MKFRLQFAVLCLIASCAPVLAQKSSASPPRRQGRVLSVRTLPLSPHRGRWPA